MVFLLHLVPLPGLAFFDLPPHIGRKSVGKSGGDYPKDLVHWQLMVKVRIKTRQELEAVLYLFQKSPTRRLLIERYRASEFQLLYDMRVREPSYRG